MKKLLYLLFVSTLVWSCKTAEHQPISDTMNMEVISINNEYVGDYQISMKLDTDENKITGKSTCNTYGANFDAKKRKMEIDAIYSTKKMCGEQEMKIEKDLLTNLEKIKRYKFDGETLKLNTNRSTTVITAILK